MWKIMNYFDVVKVHHVYFVVIVESDFVLITLQIENNNTYKNLNLDWHQHLLRNSHSCLQRPGEIKIFISLVVIQRLNYELSFNFTLK